MFYLCRTRVDEVQLFMLFNLIFIIYRLICHFKKELHISGRERQILLEFWFSFAFSFSTCHTMYFTSKKFSHQSNVSVCSNSNRLCLILRLIVNPGKQETTTQRQSYFLSFVIYTSSTLVVIKVRNWCR